jgi:tetratricopeptide (TPR) repeat protein
MDFADGAAVKLNLQELGAIYGLARLYYEMGYLSASERILNGLVEIDEGQTPSRVALGVVKLESGRPEEAIQMFRTAVKFPRRQEDQVAGKLGLVASFLYMGDLERGKLLVREIQQDMEQNVVATASLRNLWEAFAIRCGVVGQ